jgi:hypothetical protein
MKLLWLIPLVVSSYAAGWLGAMIRVSEEVFSPWLNDLRPLQGKEYWAKAAVYETAFKRYDRISMFHRTRPEASKANGNETTTEETEEVLSR